MKKTNLLIHFFIITSVIFFLFACVSDRSTGINESMNAQNPDNFVLTIVHVADTHSKMEPTLVGFKLDINEFLKQKTVYVEAGGLPSLMNALENIRATEKNTLFLHAGDMFQGSLYFTKYLGTADVDFFNLLKLDAMTLGNHEFDKGPGVLNENLLKKARFKILSANLDYSKEEKITEKDKIQPYFIKELNGEKIGIIGFSLPDTPFISSPGENIIFDGAPERLQGYIDKLTAAGVNKIILLSHTGLNDDINLSRVLEGVDVIIGGHTHSLLGDFSSLGIKSDGEYPVTVKDKKGNTVLIVHANEWEKVLGFLQVNFDKSGKIISYNAHPRFLVNKNFFRIYDLPNLANESKRVEYKIDDTGKESIKEYDGKAYTTDVTGEQFRQYADAFSSLEKNLGSNSCVLLTEPHPEGSKKLAFYAAGVDKLKKEIVANVSTELVRGMNKGPGVLIADAMKGKTGADVAIMNPGGVRINLIQGPLSVATVYELQPFGNRLVTFNCNGGELVNAFEDMVDFQISRYGINNSSIYIYVAGVRFKLETFQAKGSRIKDVQVIDKTGSFKPLSANTTYKVVVNNFMADGGDKNDTLKMLKGKYDTGFIDSEIFMEYIEGKNLNDITEERVKVVTSPVTGETADRKSGTTKPS